MQCCVNDIHIHLTGKEGRLNSSKSLERFGLAQVFLGKEFQGQAQSLGIPGNLEE